MNRQANDGFDGSNAAEIDDGNDFPGDIGKAVALAPDDFRRPLQFAGEIRGEERFDGGAALRTFQVAARDNDAVLTNGQEIAVVLKMAAQSGQPLVAQPF